MNTVQRGNSDWQKTGHVGREAGTVGWGREEREGEEVNKKCGWLSCGGAHLNSIQYSCVMLWDWRAASHSYEQTGSTEY